PLCPGRRGGRDRRRLDPRGALRRRCAGLCDARPARRGAGRRRALLQPCPQGRAPCGDADRDGVPDRHVDELQRAQLSPADRRRSAHRRDAGGDRPRAGRRLAGADDSRVPASRDGHGIAADLHLGPAADRGAGCLPRLLGQTGDDLPAVRRGRGGRRDFDGGVDAAPSSGAFSVYDLPSGVSRHLALALDGRYAHALVGLLAHGPGRISPTAAKGLIGFPSYHAVLALLVVWYARPLAVIRWIALAINGLVLIATPIQGGHHVIDVVAGFAVAALAIRAADLAIRHATRPGAAPALTVEPASL